MAPEDWRPDPDGEFAERFYLHDRPTMLVRDANGEQHIAPLRVPVEDLGPDPVSLWSVPAEPERTLLIPSQRDDHAAAAHAHDPGIGPFPVGARRVRSVGRAVMVLVLAALLAGAGTAGFRVWQERQSSHPDTWDPQVADLVAFVEEARGLTFRHPVAVRFEDPAAARTDVPTAASGEDLAVVAAQLRAVGLAADGAELAPAARLADPAPSVVFDATEKVLRVPGDDLTPALRVALVHALVLALQDQHFAPSFQNPETAQAVRALVEGDAARIRDAYRDRLIAEEPGAASALEAAPDPGDAVAAAGALPVAFVEAERLAATYGPPLVAALAAIGEERLNEAFRRPPSSDAQVVWPSDFLAGRSLPAPSRPEVRPDEEIVPGAEGPMGVLRLYLLLAARLDDFEALGAVLGYLNDDGVTVRRASQLCVRHRVETEDTSTRDRLLASLEAWEAAGPAAAAAVRAIGDTTLLLEACTDPAAPPPPDDLADSALLFLLHARLSEGFRGEGVARVAAQCAAVGVVSSFPLADLAAGTVDTAALTETTDRALRFCGALR